MSKITKGRVLDLLGQYKKQFGEKYGINELGVFGSVATETNTEASNIDVVIKIRQPNLVTMSHIRIDLEDLTNGHVDLIHYREKMNQIFKKRIENEAVYV